MFKQRRYMESKVTRKQFWIYSMIFPGHRAWNVLLSYFTLEFCFYLIDTVNLCHLLQLLASLVKP